MAPRIAQISAIAALCALLSSPAIAKMNPAVVNVSKVMEASPHWKKAVGVLEKQRKEKQTLLESEQLKLKDRKKKIDEMRVVISPDKLAGKEEALFKDAQALTQRFMQEQQVLARQEKHLTDQMLSRVELLVREIALQGEYSFVFETGTDAAPNVLYSSPKLDITPRVIKLYQKRYKDKPLQQ